MTCEICKTMTDQHDARFHELADRLAKIEAKPDVGTWIEDVERRVCELEAQLTLPTSSEGRLPSTPLASAESVPRCKNWCGKDVGCDEGDMHPEECYGDVGACWCSIQCYRNGRPLNPPREAAKDAPAPQPEAPAGRCGRRSCSCRTRTGRSSDRCEACVEACCITSVACDCKVPQLLPAEPPSEPARPPESNATYPRVDCRVRPGRTCHHEACQVPMARRMKDEPPSEPAQACCDLHRDTGKDDAPCLWKLPDGSITSIPPAPSEPATATVAERNFTPIVSGAPVLTTSEIEASWKRDHEPAKAPLSTMVTVNRQLWEQTRERALKVADLERRLVTAEKDRDTAAEMWRKSLETRWQRLGDARVADLTKRLATTEAQRDAWESRAEANLVTMREMGSRLADAEKARQNAEEWARIAESDRDRVTDDLTKRLVIEQQARVDALTLAASWKKRAEAAEKERDDALEAESAISECQAQAVLAERARVQALDACDEKIRAAFIFERARVNGWWRWYFQGEWTGAKADQRDAGIASGAPAPKGTP